MHIRQTDRPYAKNRLVDRPAHDKPEDETRKMRARRRTHAIIARKARRYAGSPVLVVMQKGFEEALEDMPALPPNVEVAHHNNLAGIDRWKDAALLIVIGRTSPKFFAPGRIAEALTGVAVTPPEGPYRYEKVDARREMTDGSFLPAKADRHPDPVAEAIRWQICEGELVQIIGRGRGINRTAANPLE